MLKNRFQGISVSLQNYSPTHWTNPSVHPKLKGHSLSSKQEANLCYLEQKSNQTLTSSCSSCRRWPSGSSIGPTSGPACFEGLYWVTPKGSRPELLLYDREKQLLNKHTPKINSIITDNIHYSLITSLWAETTCWSKERVKEKILIITYTDTADDINIQTKRGRISWHSGF